MTPSYKPSEDIRGASQLTKDALVGIVDLVEALHVTIQRLGRTEYLDNPGRARGITGFVYGAVRTAARVLAAGSDVILQRLTDAVDNTESSTQREAIVSILNGVMGDYLEENKNPLAIKMNFRKDGSAVDFEKLSGEIEQAGGQLMLFIHGLCMNDLQWQRKGMDYASSLSEETGIPNIHLHYNTGRHISENGKEFTSHMEHLVKSLPTLKSIKIVGHSMGGLVTRSGMHEAEKKQHSWPSIVSDIVFLGTPHNGALLERAGNWFEMLMDNTAYTRPFTQLGRIRSNGITDLRYAYLCDSDWAQKNVHKEKGEHGKFVPLPADINYYAIAGTSSVKESKVSHQLIGDGLVTVSSAFGEHDEFNRSLKIPYENRFLFKGVGHLDLMSDERVLERLLICLKK